jgi:hypothetical protein
MVAPAARWRQAWCLAFWREEMQQAGAEEEHLAILCFLDNE